MNTNMKSELPASLDQDPIYRQAQDRLSVLQAQLVALEAEINTSAQRPRIDGLTERAQALLASGPGVDHGESEAKLQRLFDERRVLVRAIELQRVVMDGEWGRVSKEIAAAMRPKHQELVRAVVRAAVALASANARESAFRYELERRGILYQSGSIRPMGFLPDRVGYLADSNSLMSMFVREAVQYGYLTQSEADRSRNEE